MPRRNANGEGNIRQRKDGRWEGRTWVHTSDGREIRASVYGNTWDEVHEKLTSLKVKTQAGVRIAGTLQSVDEFMVYWLREVAGTRVRPSTLRTYEWLSRCYVVPMLGTHRLSKLQPPTIRTFLNRAKTTCQCCAQGKDAARVAHGKRPGAVRDDPGSAASRRPPTAPSGTSIACSEQRFKTP